ncbi:MAG: TonB family protein [Sandaracinaceae bacterium]|nr:TonB family protein [Sandaracinaceae bacterium]
MSTLSFEAALAFGSRGEGLGGVGAVFLAGALHLGLALLSLTLPAASPHTPPLATSMEVDLAAWRAPTTPELDAPLLRPPEAPEPVPAAAAEPVRVAREPRELAPQATEQPPPEPPPAAHAGALLTATADPSAGATPVRFVSDPTGTRFGFGVVARGGTASHGVLGASASGQGPPSPMPTLQPPSAGPVVTPASQLSRPPRLDEQDACRGHFPAGSRVDQGVVTLRVVVQASGAAARVSVERETPVDQGFGQAARQCLRAARFTPALGVDGTPTTAAARVTIRFSR